MIFVDTGVLYALIDKNDINHLSAREFYKDAVKTEALSISLPVMTEAWLLVDARLGTYFADKLWQSVIAGIFDILELNREDLIAALDIENKYGNAGFGFVDATCFALCERYKISRVFTYDRKHFSIYRPGFTDFLEIIPQNNME